MPRSGSFKFVYIPADTSEEIQELSQEYTEENEVQCLLDGLKVTRSASTCPPHRTIWTAWVGRGCQELR